MKNILFVCTGNTCRSPMAAAILLSKKLPGVEVKSVGLFAADGETASQHARTILQQKNINFHHSSKKLEESDLTWASLILTMTSAHKQFIISNYPEVAKKTFTLNEYVGQKDTDISDPFGGNEQVYGNTFNELEDLIDGMIALPKFNQLDEKDN